MAAMGSGDVMKPIARITGPLGKIPGGIILVIDYHNLSYNANTTTGDWTKYGVDVAAYVLTNYTKSYWTIGAGLIIGIFNQEGGFDDLYNSFDMYLFLTYPARKK